MSFIAENTFLWQKLAVPLSLADTDDSVLNLLRKGVNILLIRFGLHTRTESIRILDVANKAIEIYSSEIHPWKPTIGIACELSGKAPRLKFHRNSSQIELFPGQRLFLTCDTKYEDKQVNNIMYVTNMENLITKLKIGDLATIDGINLKICKIKGKFLECCVRNNSSNRGLPIQLNAYDRVKFEVANSKWETNAKEVEECQLAIDNNCRFVVIPDLDDHMQVHAVDELLQLYQIGDRTVRTIAKFAGSMPDICRKQNVQHLAGVITNDQSLVGQCKECCRAVLYDVTDLNQLPGDETLHKVDVFIVDSFLVEPLKDIVKEANCRTISDQTALENISSLGQKQCIFSQCIEYASVACKANAVILCTSKAACEPEKLSRKKLPCPVLIATSDEDVIYHLLLRKYCFPVYIPESCVKSTKQLVKYTTVYGRRFGYLKPGNAIVTGFGEHTVQGIEFRYVPDDFVLRIQ